MYSFFDSLVILLTLKIYLFGSGRLMGVPAMKTGGRWGRNKKIQRFANFYKVVKSTASQTSRCH